MTLLTAGSLSLNTLVLASTTTSHLHQRQLLDAVRPGDAFVPSTERRSPSHFSLWAGRLLLPLAVAFSGCASTPPPMNRPFRPVSIPMPPLEDFFRDLDDAAAVRELLQSGAFESQVALETVTTLMNPPSSGSTATGQIAGRRFEISSEQVIDGNSPLTIRVSTCRDDEERCPELERWRYRPGERIALQEVRTGVHQNRAAVLLIVSYRDDPQQIHSGLLIYVD